MDDNNMRESYYYMRTINFANTVLNTVLEQKWIIFVCAFIVHFVFFLLYTSNEILTKTYFKYLVIYVTNILRFIIVQRDKSTYFIMIAWSIWIFMNLTYFLILLHILQAKYYFWIIYTSYIILNFASYV